MAISRTPRAEVEATGHHVEFLVEDLSMEAFLRVALPRMLSATSSFNVHAFRGKSDLIRKLGGRLRGYERWIPPGYRIVVLVDRDDQDCHVLKAELEAVAAKTTLVTRSRAGDGTWRVANRIAVEELEAWYFGDWEAVRKAFPRVSAGIPRQASYRDPDAIRGGTWEAFERVMKQHGYFATGLRKLEAAQAIAAHIHPDRNRSKSFRVFRSILAESTTA